MSAKREKRRTLTPHQVVAYNLKRAREYRGWKQREAAEQLARFGVKWSLPSFSVAEHSWEPGARGREFDAVEIMAMAEAFELPIGWFFLPPDAETGVQLGGSVVSAGGLLERLYGPEPLSMYGRVEDLLRDLPAKEGGPLYRKLKSRRSGRLVDEALRARLRRFDHLTEDIGRLHAALQEAREAVATELVEDQSQAAEGANVESSTEEIFAQMESAIADLPSAQREMVSGWLREVRARVEEPEEAESADHERQR